MPEKKEAERQNKSLVVNELPVETIRDYIDNDGNEFKLITIQEALTEILEAIREIKKIIK